MIIVSVIGILGSCIQVKFQSQTLSPFETHFWIMSIFLIALVAFGLVEYFLIAYDHHHHHYQHSSTPDDRNSAAVEIMIGFLRETRHIFGALPPILLLHILSSTLGWVITVFVFTPCLLKKAYDHESTKDMVKDVFFKVVDKMKNMPICSVPDDVESPV